MAWNASNNSKGASEIMIARENQNNTDSLSGKVNRLKMLALDMEDEVNEQNRYINSMDGEFDGTTGLLSGSMKRMGYMIGSSSSNRKYMCYIVTGTVALFIFFYYIVASFRG